MITNNLLTGGLGGPACCGLITWHFGVGNCICKINVKISKGGGGSRPKPPGHAEDHFHYVDPQYYSGKTYSKFLTVEIKIGKTEFKKEYTINTLVYEALMRAIQMKNFFRRSVNLAINQVKRITKVNIRQNIINIINIRKKKDS